MIELVAYINSLVGIKYKKNPPFSKEEGFNCFSFVSYVWNLFSDARYVLDTDFTCLRGLRSDFIKVPLSEERCFLDIPLFFTTDIEARHIGIMLDKNIMIHCSSATNGVARSDITRKPWSSLLKAIYRHK